MNGQSRDVVSGLEASISRDAEVTNVERGVVEGVVRVGEATSVEGGGMYFFFFN